jgi:hypothetical protein
LSTRKYFLSEDEVRVIGDHYDGTNGQLNKIMRIINAGGPKYPRWYIRRIASEKGWSRTKIADWTAEEEEWLAENYPRKGYVALQNGLKRINGGILRTPCAIILKKKRLGINKRSDGLTMRMMEDLFGVDHHRVERWMNLGMLTAKRKGTDRTEANGGDMWHFEPKILRAFVINHPEEVDLRRVEPLNFINLLAGLM